MQERRERLAGRAPVQALERTVVEHAVDPPHLLVEDGVERAAPGQDLAHDAVAVLVRPALPGMVRLREVDLDPERLLELLEEGELLAVVERSGLQHVLRDPGRHPDDRRHHAVALLRRDAGDEREARHALDQCREMPRAAQPVDAAFAATRERA